MNKCYLLVYGATLDRSLVSAWADRWPVVNWRFDLPNSIYLISPTDSAAIANSFIETFGRGHLFVITELTTNTQGMLTQETWNFFRERATAAPAPPPLAAGKPSGGLAGLPAFLTPQAPSNQNRSVQDHFLELLRNHGVGKGPDK
jgi:hypothetical protein